MSYQPPQSIWDVPNQLNYDQPLDPGDARYVETEAARGERFNNALLRDLGIDPRTMELKTAPQRRYALYCGHRGCGKSTELRHLADTLDVADKYAVIFLDVVRALDSNNLQVPDVLLALAQQLIERVEREGIGIDQVFLTNLENWFKTRIESHEQTKQFATEIKAGAKVKSGIPFLGEVFAAITNAFKVNSTYKEEIRLIVKNYFSEFAQSFNQLILHAETKLKTANKGHKLLFIVDGTDRLGEDNGQRFFLTDVHQLQLIEGNFIYCAPIYLTHESSHIHQNFAPVFRLPMIKLHEKGDANRIGTAYQTMRDILYRRAPLPLFDSPNTVDYLIQHSGGHPRDLLRLVNYAFQSAEGDIFDRPAAEKAVKKLATEYRRILDAEDFQRLREIDQAPSERAPNSAEARRLLFNLALLEYNDFWWQTHPAIRTLPDYQQVASS